MEWISVDIKERRNRLAEMASEACNTYFRRHCPQLTVNVLAKKRKIMRPASVKNTGNEDALMDSNCR